VSAERVERQAREPVRAPDARDSVPSDQALDARIGGGRALTAASARLRIAESIEADCGADPEVSRPYSSATNRAKRMTTAGCRAQHRSSSDTPRARSRRGEPGLALS
jgi:hypothetical protein